MRTDACPLDYRYRPSGLSGPADLAADVVYVVGGLYGNVEALRAVLEMKRRDETETGLRVRLVFNGDFNWFDCADESFGTINREVLAHHALRGNVETELALLRERGGCGCNYPSWVDDETVALSNEIIQRLGETADRCAGIRQRFAELAMHCVVDVGEQRVAIVHGDAESLAGWHFAVEAMPDAGGGDTPRSSTGARADAARARIAGYFDQARVLAFACTHTGLPFMQDFAIGGRPHLIVNNGAAGLPNFEGELYGILTRIAAHPARPAASLYGIGIEGVRFDALPIRYDTAAWWARFSSTWPPGSAARRGYERRIRCGPDYRIGQARRLGESSMERRPMTVR